MRVEVICSYFKEEYLIPLFMLHYEPFVDKVTLLTFKCPDGKLDDGIKINEINAAISKSDADWVIVADADEMIFPKNGADPRTTLEQEQGSICNCEMLRVWRHMSEQDIDRMQPPLLQRRHGEPDHIKPCIFRPPVTIDIGTHGAKFPDHYKWGQPWSAVHWANADPEFGIERTHRDRQTRLSQNNYDHGWGMVPEWLDPGYLQNLYAKHLNDPKVI